MDHYFKIRRAKEEIQRLNIEIKRVATYLRDEYWYLKNCTSQVERFDLNLSYQIQKHAEVRSRFNHHHLRRLDEISRIRGFNASIQPGRSLATGLGESASMPNILELSPSMPVELAPTGSVNNEFSQENFEEALQEEEEDEDEEEEESRAALDILQASEDFDGSVSRCVSLLGNSLCGSNAEATLTSILRSRGLFH